MALAGGCEYLEDDDEPCDEPAVRQCPRCGGAFCAEHIGREGVCAECKGD